MTKFEKFVMAVLIVILVLVAIMIATGEIRIVIVIGEKIIDKAKTIDVKQMGKLIDFVMH